MVLLGVFAPKAWAQTVIFNASATAQPGDAFSLQGSFGAGAKIFLTAGSSTTPVAVPIMTQMAGQATGQIPANLPPNLYQVWVDDGGQRSPSVYLNQARGQHFDSPEVAAGGRLRLFGRNLFMGGGAQVRFVGAGGASVQADAGQSDAYTLSFNAPTSLQSGTTYQVMVSNGYGGETAVDFPIKAVDGGADYFNLGVGWAGKLNFYANVYNVQTDGRLSQKARGDGSTNDQQAVQAAMDRAAADGGGVVYLPAGTYKFAHGGGAGLLMRNRVVVRGAGKDQTIIKFGYGNVSPDRWGVIWNNTQQAGLADLSIINVNDSGQYIQNMTGVGTEIFMQRVRFDMNTGDWLWLANSNKLVIANSDFTQGVDDKAGYHGPIQLSGCSNFVLSNNNFTFAVYGLNMGSVHEGVLENNRVYRDGSARYPTSLTNHVLILDFAQNVALLNNQISVIKGPAQNSNDGEAIIAEGGGSGGTRIDEDAGTVSAAGGNTLQDNNKNWGAFRQQPVVAIVSGNGMGQWRTITSRSGNRLTLDRAWDVTPSAGSHYAIFNWGARNWLVKGNTLVGHRRGITFYQNATLQVAVVGNTLTNSGSIDFMPYQGNNGYQMFTPMYNNQIVGNNVANTDGSNGVFIGGHVTQSHQTQTFGTSMINLDVRNNTLTAHSPNVPAVVDDNFPEGYLNYLTFQENGGRYVDEKIPALLGSVFQNNTAINCDNALYINSGSYGTLVCNTNLVNTPNLLQDNRIIGLTHTSVGTASCLGSTVSALRTPENPDNTDVGLNYQYFEGNWNSLPNFGGLTAIKSSIATAFDLSVRQREYGYALQYTGFITVPADGQYTFSTNSDDGSRLYIGSTLVVDNDGPHQVQEVSGTIGLKAGTHAFTLTYFQGAASQVLEASYLGPGVPKQPITSAVLRRASTGLRTPENPTSTATGLDYTYVEGYWNTLPDFTNLAATKAGTATAFDLGQRQRDYGYAMQYTGYVTVPTDGQYTFTTGSDDGSQLLIGSTLVVDNDGLHDYAERAGTIGLKAGTHAITIRYLQGAGGQRLTVSYQGPNLAKQTVPAAALQRATTTTVTRPAPGAGLRTPENPSNTASGLDYKYYEGTWNNLPNFGALATVASGTAATPNLDGRRRDLSYAMQYTGYVTVPTDGQYTFTTGSDDGSQLFIGSALVVDNDGLHGYLERSGTIGLQAGTHAITVTYLQNGGGQSLTVSYQGPSFARQAVPASAWSRLTTAATIAGLRTPENPANTTSGLDYKYYEGYWNTLPAFSSLGTTKAGTATTTTFNLGQRQRDYGYAMQYTGYVTVPTDGQYTFTTGSDDGSQLLIGSTLVVDNDGLHGYLERSGTIGLQAGTHAITVAYLQGGGSQTLAVSYQGPNQTKQTLLPASMRRVAAGSSTAAAKGRVALAEAATPEVAPTALSVYPNPSTGAFTVEFSMAKAQTATLTLIDALGRTVQQQQVQVQEGPNRIAYQASGVAQGIYRLTLVGADGQRQGQKVTISH
ncbi:T9SS C-terminal target domain-containing protein [Hymenobacter nivis]|uniref:T9SS C-terminal target domain-containing protein n=1 Tax=Hymenobacter nivis TaxID=1850093 RepID=A0A502GP90_9BACT|nr:T9SS C-terminal target domain-containing protein [Hymenobacter nivis]